MILVCDMGVVMDVYSWECSQTSCESVFRTTLGRTYYLKDGLTAVDTQYCNMECYFQSILGVFNPSIQYYPFMIYSENSNVIECS